MSKLISILLFSALFVHSDKMTYPSIIQVEKDLNKNLNLIKDKFLLESILKYYPTDTAAKHDFYFDKYCFIHVSIPDEYECSLNDSPVLLYVKGENNWILKSVLSGLYDFKQINNTNFFLSETSCTQMNSEQIFLSKLYKFKNEKFEIIKEISGYDKSMYFLEIYEGGQAFENGKEGYERYEGYKEKLERAIGDTIVDYSILKSFIQEKNTISSYVVERKIKVIKGINPINENGLNISEKTTEEKIKLNN